MQRTLIVGLLALAIASAGGYLYITRGGATEGSVQSDSAAYSSSEVELAFMYDSGPDGYVLEERMPGAADKDLLRTITLTQTADHERMTTNPPVGGEGPAVIAISVFSNTEKQFPLAWAQENLQFSSFNLKTSDELEAVVGGANAISYTADGLYASDNVVVAHGGYIYVFTGQFMDADSPMRQDFESLVASVQFIPPSSAIAD
jgi:hypothetical protein